MQTYGNQRIVIRYDPQICCHAGECVRGLPQVFDISKQPWVNVDGADPESIAEVIQRCPSGALSCEFPAGAD